MTSTHGLKRSMNCSNLHEMSGFKIDFETDNMSGFLEISPSKTLQDLLEETSYPDFKRPRYNEVSDDDESGDSFASPATEALQRALDLDEFSNSDDDFDTTNLLVSTPKGHKETSFDDHRFTKTHLEYTEHTTNLMSTLTHNLADLTTRQAI